MKRMPDNNPDPLRKILNRDMLEKPSDNFTGSVMNSLGLSPGATAVKYEPVISLRGWILIGSIFITLVFLGLSGENGSQGNSGYERLESLIANSTSVFENMLTGSVMLTLTVAAAAILLLTAVDGYYRRTRIHAI